jgi:Ca2+-binding EF-hand superfamily protein
MRKVAMVLAAVLVVGTGSFGEPVRAATRQVGEKAEATGEDEQLARAEGVIRSLRLARRVGAIADLDGDGMITRDEAMRHVDLRFARMDADRDEVLTEAEFIRAPVTGAAHGRGGAASADLRNAGFEAADLDGDGSLGPEEFLQAEVRDATGRESAPRQRARLAIFRGLDDEGDGVISREDFMMRTAARFAARDVDGDGALPVWEFVAVLRF